MRKKVFGLIIAFSLCLGVLAACKPANRQSTSDNQVNDVTQNTSDTKENQTDKETADNTANNAQDTQQTDDGQDEITLIHPLVYSRVISAVDDDYNSILNCKLSAMYLNKKEASRWPNLNKTLNEKKNEVRENTQACFDLNYKDALEFNKNNDNKTYYVDESGSLKASMPFYSVSDEWKGEWIDNYDSNLWKFTLLKDIKGKIMQTDSEAQDYTISKGTEVIYMSTDSNSWADLKTDNGDIVRVPIDAQNQTICDMQVGDALDGVMFAG